MPNDYFTFSDEIAANTRARAEQINPLLRSVETGFGRLPSKNNLNLDMSTYAVDTGAANAYVAALPLAVTSYTAGMRVSVKITTTNTGASTLNAGGGVRSIKLFDGTATTAGDLTAGDIATFRYDGTNFVMEGTPRSMRWSAVDPSDIASPQDYGASGADASVDDTAAVLAWLQAGGGVARTGTFYIDEITVTSKCVVECLSGVVFKKRSGVAANSKLIKFAAGSEGSVIRNIVIDGNRTTLQAAYDAVNPSNPAYGSGWFTLAVECENVTLENATIQNSAGSPLWCPGNRAKITNMTIDNFAAAAVYGYKLFGSSGTVARPAGASGYRQEINGVHFLNYDNGNSAVYQHVADFQACAESRYVGLVCTAADGDTGGESAWLSGYTFENCIQCFIGSPVFTSPTTDSLIHLGISMLGCIGCQVDSPFVYDIAGQAFEWNACVDCTVTNPIFDGNYAATTAVPATGADSAKSHGFTFYRGAWNDYRTAKSLAGNIRCKVFGVAIKRFTYGGFQRDHSSSFFGTFIYGNRLDGVYSNEETFTDHFVGAAQSVNEISEFNGCHIFNNGRAGIHGPAQDRMKIVSCEIFNNGQDINETSTARAALSLNDLENSHISGNGLYDDQSWTLTDGASFEPASASTTLNIYSVSLANMGEGQKIKIVNGTGAGDIDAKIVDIGVDDKITLEAASAVALSSTGNTAALTGTWSGSGVTLSGISTAANTELPGSYWITDGSEWRRVTKVASATSITIDRAFTAVLSGASLTVLKVDLQGIPSQQYGIRAFGSAAEMLYSDNRSKGNVVADEEFSTPSNLEAGSSYTRTATVTIDAGNVNLFTGIDEKHRLVGVTARVDTAFDAGTSWSLVLRDSAVSLIETITSGIGITQNSKATGTVNAGSNTDTGNKTLRCETTGGTPTSGQVTVKARFRVDAPDEFADV